MYYIVRILFAMLIIFGYIVLVKKSKKLFFVSKVKNPEYYEILNRYKKLKRKHNIINISIILGFITIIGFSFYPFEGYFISFPTLKEAFSYYFIDSSNFEVYEYPDSVFLVDKDSDKKIYSVTKSGNAYKLVNFNSVDLPYYNTRKNIRGEEYYAKFNKEINRTFYLVGVSFQDTDKLREVKLNGEDMHYLYSEKVELLYLNNSYKRCYYYFSEKQKPKDSFTINTGERIGSILLPDIYV